MGNSFGNIFKLTSFGESHGSSIGGIIDGCPSGLFIDLNFIQEELDRRRPGQSKITTSRIEGDKVVFMSGIFEGKTTGTPIGFTISNNNFKSEDYDKIKNQTINVKKYKKELKFKTLDEVERIINPNDLTISD